MTGLPSLPAACSSRNEGGLSFPKVGTDGTGHRFMEKLGHTLGKGIYPALTPIVADHPAGKNLAGVSLYSVALECVGPEKKKKKKKKKATGAMRTGLLFTHRGTCHRAAAWAPREGIEDKGFRQEVADDMRARVWRLC